MRTFLACLATFLLALLSPVVSPSNHAQDVPKTNQLADYLGETDAARKAALKAELLKLTPEQLRALMLALPLAAADSGEKTFELACPDKFTRKYFVTVPPGYDVAQSYPLVVLLHGGVNGNSEEAGASMASAWHMYMKDEQKKGVFFLAPSANCENTTINARWWREGGMNNILTMIAAVKSRYHIDDERVFLSGGSDGGSGTWAISMRRPDTFAGFFPMVGHPLVAATDRTAAFYENLKGTNLFNISGGKDPVYPGGEVSKIVGEINSVGPKILHKNYEQAGHDMSYAEVEISHILELMGTWKRDLLAKSLDWSTDRACFGSRAWICIDETKELERDFNKAPKATARGTGVIRIDLGVRVATPTTPEDMNKPVKVKHLEPGSVAEMMGMKEGDVITKVDGKKCGNLDEVNAVLRTKGAGKEISVTVDRAGAEVSMKGRFPPLEKDPAPGRVQGTWTVGSIDVKTNNVRRLTLRIAPEMLDAKGELRVKVNGKEAFKGKPMGDVALMLEHFEQTWDKGWPFVWEIKLDVERK
jgi:poly(3-hydroxybutyrate) depolymerase